jgi:preprotein translocase subunit SecG
MVILTYILFALVIILSVLLVCVILIQRGKGGGLAGAFGGVGGSSAFGTKAGDVFTHITLGMAGVWILLCMGLVILTHRDANTSTLERFTGGAGSDSSSSAPPNASTSAPGPADSGSASKGAAPGGTSDLPPVIPGDSKTSDPTVLPPSGESTGKSDASESSKPADTTPSPTPPKP